MNASQSGQVEVWNLGVDVDELGKQYYLDESADQTHLAAFECTGAAGEAESWCGTPLRIGKVGEPITFQMGGRLPCQVAGGIGSVPMPLKLGAGGKLVVAGAVGDQLVAKLLQPLTGDGTVTVSLHTQYVKQEALPPSLGG